MTQPAKFGPKLMKPAEVAPLFRVHVKTVIRWARLGQLESIQTPTGRWLFPEPAVRELLRTGKPS